MALRAASLVVALAAGVATAPGCSSGAASSQISGTVTLDGAPLKTGQIRFVPVDGQTPTAGAVITDGKYSTKLAPGEKTVEISSPREAPARPMYSDAPPPPAAAGGELVPARYNANTELKIEIKGGDNTKDFALTSP
jgi:hypothetical protein